jgi:hypothetical protein
VWRGRQPFIPFEWGQSLRHGDARLHRGVDEPGTEPMARVIADRMTARIDGDFVVFLIGMRINKPWKVHRWWPVFIAMPRMIRELEAVGPETGFLGHTGIRLHSITQYWRSFDHLEAYARRAGGLHMSAWADFNRAARNARDDVGIWHETYLVRSGEYESLYSGMPPFGLGRVGRLEPASGSRENARGRLSGR